ncbi:MAG: hypothetical protein IK086_01265 [Clostridia bacterium]|nr:hypothetical protein [Clostridia bacterium]
MRVLIIGGDRRMQYAKAELEAHGFTAEVFSGAGDLKSADIILLPVPLTRDGVNINCPEAREVIPLGILDNLSENTLVFGGGKLNIKNYTDYLALDEYAVKNAALTAEGAISYAIDNTDFSLYRSDILVIGYGRTGRVLADRLKAFAPRLTVSARSGRDFASLDTLGIRHIKTGSIENCKTHFDIVFNTVDIKFSIGAANALKSALFLDLSSRGGFIEGAAEQSGINYVKLPGIPGKVAPRTAGKIIAETVINSVKGE